MSSSIEPVELQGVMKSLRRAKMLLLLLIFIALVVQAAGFVLVEFTDLVVRPYKAEATASADQLGPPAEKKADAEKSAASKPAGKDVATGQALTAEQEKDKSAVKFRNTLHWILPGARFIGLVSGSLVTIVLMLAVMVSLMGRGGGAARMVGAFCWSLILLAMLTPWRQILGGSVACGVFYNLSELMTQYRKIHNLGAEEYVAMSLYYARFLGYPAVALLAWLAVQIKFAQGYKRIVGGKPTAGPGPLV
ncbi:MAG: hypothetical protein K8S55_09550 [Phycisphaerae bacterium]|nr:hypothetical protein [Phycisphaerae bacterium]